MTEITGSIKLNSDIDLALVAAPFVTLMLLMSLLYINLALAAAIERISTAPETLIGVASFFGSATFLAFLAIPFGILQFVLISGWVLQRYLVRRAPNPVMVAVLALAANTAVFGVAFMLSAAVRFDGLSTDMNFFLLMGGIFAPAWGCVAGFFIHRRQNQRSGRHV